MNNRTHTRLLAVAHAMDELVVSHGMERFIPWMWHAQVSVQRFDDQRTEYWRQLYEILSERSNTLRLERSGTPPPAGQDDGRPFKWKIGDDGDTNVNLKLKCPPRLARLLWRGGMEWPYPKALAHPIEPEALPPGGWARMGSDVWQRRLGLCAKLWRRHMDRSSQGGSVPRAWHRWPLVGLDLVGPFPARPLDPREHLEDLRADFSHDDKLAFYACSLLSLREELLPTKRLTKEALQPLFAEHPGLDLIWREGQSPIERLSDYDNPDRAESMLRDVKNAMEAKRAKAPSSVNRSSVSSRGVMAAKVRKLLTGAEPYEGTKSALAKEAGYTHSSSLKNIKHFENMWNENVRKLAEIKAERQRRFQTDRNR